MSADPMNVNTHQENVENQVAEMLGLSLPPFKLLDDVTNAVQELKRAKAEVSVQTRARRLRIRIPSLPLALWPALCQIWQGLRRSAPTVELDVIQEQPSERFASDEIEEAQAFGALLYAVAKEQPLFQGMLHHARYHYELNRLTLYVATLPDGVALTKLTQRIEALLSSFMGTKTHFNFKLHENRDEIVEAFRREVETTSMEFGRQQTEAIATDERPVAANFRLQIGGAIEEQARRCVELQDEMNRVVIEGRIFGVDIQSLKNGRKLYKWFLTDETDSLTCKYFSNANSAEESLDSLRDGLHLRVRGSTKFDVHDGELVMMVRDVQQMDVAVQKDEMESKRIELHAHTKMSALDSVVSAFDLVKHAAELGHRAIAITDHGVAQAYPDAYKAGKTFGIDILYGVEAYLVDAGLTIVSRSKPDVSLDSQTYVIFDTETTGLSAAEDELIEIAGVKMTKGTIVDTFSHLIRPKRSIPPKISEITQITNDMVTSAPSVEEVLPQFQAFCKGALLVAHNAEFDQGFLDVQCRKLGMARFDQPILDTLSLARCLYPGERNHKLKTLTQKFSITLINHHRALADAEATGHVFFKMMDHIKQEGIATTLDDLNALGRNQNSVSRSRPHHMTILTATRHGLRNLYELISLSHTKYLHREPRIPRSLLLEYRKGLLFGSGCHRGELFQALVRGKSDDELIAIADFYDFIEVQPVDQYADLFDSGEVSGPAVIRQYHKRLLAIADQLGKPVVATGDVHFLYESDAVFREIVKNSIPPHKRESRSQNRLRLHFRTTREMLDDFAHFGERAHEVVVANSHRIADQIESFSPLPDRVYPPLMEGADDDVKRLAIERVHALYGDELPSVVAERVEKELHSIISNGFAVNYLIAQKLVTQSLRDGYIVGSRGSVGSSLVATLLDITEVNPLPPHYRCESCRTSEFILDGTVGSGFDLPDRACTLCGLPLIKDGQDIPFETFLGFKGDKVPDIDLNFSGEYQARAHRYTEELFGTEYVFRAGTISTIADKTAFGYVRKWAEETGKRLRPAEMRRLAAGCEGVKRTTGQHPGGLIIVPSDHEIYDFCPIQHPADDSSSQTRTTHFDFHSIHDNLLKLDILGHDDPTVLRMLEDLTGVDVRRVPVDDPNVVSLFRGTEALAVTPAQIHSNTGTFGIPEFGTKFVRQMLEDTKPATFSDLVRISGLSHGTDVWLNNAQELIRTRKIPLAQVICCRDDIMVYLIYQGLDPSRAFRIMESVRKGKGLSDEDMEVMRGAGVPDWYLQSCQRIKYMFPKAHAAAYVLNAVRIAYFKVYHPLAFYAAYFTVRASDFDLDVMNRGADAIELTVREIEQKGKEASNKETDMLTVLEVALEMTRRGFKFYPLSLEESHATHFLLKADGLLPPFAAAPGIGAAAATSITKAREESPFISWEDLRERGRASKSVIELLNGYGALTHLPVTNQLSLF